MFVTLLSPFRRSRECGLRNHADGTSSNIWCSTRALSLPCECNCQLRTSPLSRSICLSNRIWPIAKIHEEPTTRPSTKTIPTLPGKSGVNAEPSSSTTNATVEPYTQSFVFFFIVPSVGHPTQQFPVRAGCPLFTDYGASIQTLMCTPLKLTPTIKLPSNKATTTSPMEEKPCLFGTLSRPSFCFFGDLTGRTFGGRGGRLFLRWLLRRATRTAQF